jgi:integrase
LVDKPIAEVIAEDVMVVLSVETLGLDARRGLRSALKSFFSWAVEHGHAATHPIDVVPMFPMTDPRGIVCPEENVARGFSDAREDARVAVLLAAGMGLRRAEISKVNTLTDVVPSSHGMRLRVHGKGRRVRVLPVSMALQGLLRNRSLGWLFPGRFGGGCSVDYVSSLIKSATGYPPHSLRRRFATVVYYESGYNILLVSKLLGHASVGTTMRYIGLVPDDMCVAVEKAAVTKMFSSVSRAVSHPVIGGHGQAAVADGMVYGALVHDF